MTPDEIDTIRNMRGCNVPWTVISRQLGYSVAECRAAIGLPQYVASEPTVKPWDVTQRDLFSNQPDMAEVSER